MKGMKIEPILFVITMVATLVLQSWVSAAALLIAGALYGLSMKKQESMEQIKAQMAVIVAEKQKMNELQHQIQQLHDRLVPVENLVSVQSSLTRF